MPDIDLANASFDDDVVEDKPVRTRKPRSDKGQSRGTGTRGPRASSTKALADDLLVPYAMLASGLGMVAPTVTAVLLSRGEKTVDAFLKIASKHPRMLAALKKASVMGPATELATTGIQVAVAAALDFGRLPVDHPLAFSLGVTELYMATHPQPVDNPVNGFPMPSPPDWGNVPA